MSTFYLLPSRPVLGERFADYLKDLFPGLKWARVSWGGLADALGAVAASQPNVYVVYREELPEGETPASALADGFGAELGDEVVEIRPGMQAGEMVAHRWQLGGK